MKTKRKLTEINVTSFQVIRTKELSGVEKTEIEHSKCEKLLGIKIDLQLNFTEYLNDITSKTSGKIMPCLELWHIWIWIRNEYYGIPFSKHDSVTVR